MSLYVPVTVRLEIKKGANAVSLNESSQVEIEQSPSTGEKTRRRLMSTASMKKRSPPVPLAPSASTTSAAIARDIEARDAPLAPDGTKHEKSKSFPERGQCPGRRTYSEVVVETLEGDRLTQTSEVSTRPSRAGSEPIQDIDHLNYYYGNPSVEKTEGILHFYKYNDERLARESQCRMICMLAVPAQVSVPDLVAFVGPSLCTIERIKIVRDATPNQYMAIVKFKTHNDAVVFFEEYHGTPFNSMEPERCGLLFVDKVECVGESEAELDYLTEMPTCPVCLERLDEAVVSVLCNHSFHALCVQKCTDTTCPVCRYIQSPELVAEQRCSECGQSTDLWACLICGNIGCGRYEEGHAYRHFELTSHTFCLQIGRDRVWDYAGDNYVHRLIQTETDGKLVEYERGPGDRDGFEDKSDKLEGIKMEYTCLLSSQLESQRKYFEARIDDLDKAMSNMEKMTQAQMEDLERQLTASTSEVKEVKQQLAECQAGKAAAEKKHQTTIVKLTKVTNELAEEKSMNEMLRGDQQMWKKQLEESVEERKKMDKTFTGQIQELEGQVRDLMLHFEAQSKLAESKLTAEEVETSQLGVSPSKDNSKQRRSKKK